jgi:hypothetical protein
MEHVGARRVTRWPLMRSDVGRKTLSPSSAESARAATHARARRVDAGTPADLVVISPMLELGSRQVEVLRSARAFGARTILSLGNWDHLSNKGRISELPTRVFVWNDTQVAEAVELHGVPRERIVITGAQTYDQWFGRVPARTRQEFCAMLNLPADRPLLLYACSAMYPIEPSEARFVQRWIEQIRASDDPPCDRRRFWCGLTRCDSRSGTTLTCRTFDAVYGSVPIDSRSKEDYFDSLYFGAVVGLNTTAFIETAIVGRPVHTIDVPNSGNGNGGRSTFHLTTVGGRVGVGRTLTSIVSNWRVRCARRSTGVSASFVRAFCGRLASTAAPRRTSTGSRSCAFRDARAGSRCHLGTDTPPCLKPCAMALHRYVAHLDDPVDRPSVNCSACIEGGLSRCARVGTAAAGRGAAGARAEKVRLAEAARQQESARDRNGLMRQNGKTRTEGR